MEAEVVPSRKLEYRIASRLFALIYRPKGDSKSLLKSRASSSIKILQCHSCTFCSLFAPLSVNVACLAQSKLYQELGSSIILCKTHFQK
jgi:hypothetical protein